jgi:mRNA interferase RelE/StbE
VATRWSVEFTRLAREQLDALPDSLFVRISKAIARLNDSPLPAGSKRLQTEEELYRLRVGDYRVIYALDREGHAAIITRVRHRKDVYRGL